METKRNPEYVRVKELSAIIGIPVSTIWKLIREDGFPEPMRPTSRLSLFKVADALKWIEEHGKAKNGKESTAS